MDERKLKFTLLIFIGLSWVIANCSGPKTDGSETVTSESGGVEVDMEDENKPEDKSKRPSPPAMAKAQIGDLVVSINYSSPSVKERTIWGGVVSYNKVWRTGANEATIFEVNKPVRINGENLPAGKYSLFTIPSNEAFTVIFNTVWDQWGAYNYEESKDALRIAVPTEAIPESVERMEFNIDDQGMVRFRWGKLSFSFAVEAA